MSDKSDLEPGDGSRRDPVEETHTESELPTHVEESPGGPRRDSALPAAVGCYRILGKLGEGGMGVVYEAEQESPKRRVAVKVVRGGEFVDERRVRLFQREADSLARLKHPNIGGIYESGRTDDGQHFFAMELVRGETLDVYLSRRPEATTTAEVRFRLALVRKIVDAVNYAHQRGVIHRDLKPSNIIVTDAADGNAGGEEPPEIKILDFGLARITEGDVAAASMVTEVGVIKGTLAYMSPEQARGNPAEIDVRSDVYSLGVMLYEMLSGKRPYDVMNKSLVEAVRVICEESAPPLGPARGGAHRLSPDIETIAAKALEKDAERRYSSAAALSEDIGRFLAMQPILARPPSTVYQLTKLVQRNKLPAAFAATLLLLLIGFGAWMSVLYARAVRAESNATLEARTATRVADFMTGLFQLSNPGAARGEEIAVREVLDQGARQIETGLDEPEVQARMMKLMGIAYKDLGLYEKAEPLLEGALSRNLELTGEDTRTVAEIKRHLAHLLSLRGEHDRAERLSREALASLRRQLGDADIALTPIMMNMASGLLNAERNYDEAERLMREALEIQRRVLDEDNMLVADTKHTLAWALAELGELEAAEALELEVLETRRRLFGQDHHSVAWSLSNLSRIRSKQADHESAKQLAEEALEMNRRLFGDAHFEIGASLIHIAAANLALGELAPAEAAAWEALEVQWELFGHESSRLVSGLEILSEVALARGSLDESARFRAEALAISRRAFGEEHPRTAGLRSIEARREPG